MGFLFFFLHYLNIYKKKKRFLKLKKKVTMVTAVYPMKPKMATKKGSFLPTGKLDACSRPSSY